MVCTKAKKHLDIIEATRESVALRRFSIEIKVPVMAKAVCIQRAIVSMASSTDKSFLLEALYGGIEY